MSTVGQSRTLALFIVCQNQGTHGYITHVLFSQCNMKSKTDDPVVICFFAFTPETKVSPDSLCPTILILPHTTLQLLNLAHILL